MSRFVPTLLLLCACTTQYVEVGAEAPASGRRVVLHEDTFLLDDPADDLVVAADHLWVSGVEGLREGHVVVGQREGGYLRRVTEITDEGGGLRLTTEPASLRDALLEAHIHEEIPVTRRSGSDWTFRDIVLVDDTVSSSLGTAHVDARIDELWVGFEPVLVVDLELDEDDDEASVTLGFVLSSTADASVTTTGQLAHGGEVPLLSTDIPFAFAIGPVPVTGAAEVDLFAGYEVTAVGEASGGLHAEASVAADVQAGWAHGDWFADYDASTDYTVEPWVDVDGLADAEVWVRAEVGANLYGTTSVAASARPWARAEVCDLAIDPDEPAQWAVDAGVDGTVGFDLTVFGWEVWSSEPVDLTVWESELASSQSGACDG